ncbi:MAG: hypothetical protein ACI358_01515 [Candidatus Limimorpha sp.]
MKSILGNTRRADITFSSYGRIGISSRVSKSLDLQAGDVIDIMEDCYETYLYVKHRASSVVGRHEATVFQSNRRGRHYVASSVLLCRYILSKCRTDGFVRLCCGIPVTIEPYGKAIPIIVRNIL